MYLKLRHRQWWACHDIPKDVRGLLGHGARFAVPLKTEDKEVAKRRAAILEVRWRSEIEQARKGTRDHIERDAAYWRSVLRDTPEEHRDVVLDFISDETDSRIQHAMEKAGFSDYHQDGWQDLPEVEEAYRFQAIATGRLVKLDEHVDEWVATLSNEAKTKDMKKATVLKFAETFPFVPDVQRKDVQRWINRMVQDEGKKAKTIRRILSEVRGYWAYLVSIEAAPEEALPFEKLTLPKESVKEAVRDERRAFTPAEVVTLLRAAEAKGDTQLADLIRLGMWTGARIEELCALKLDKVGDGFFSVEDAKTPAGWRQVPVHSKLAPTLARLIEASRTAKDEYVLSGLTFNKYGDRSNAIGKRFGRLKDEAGFGPQHVFHSIRHTVASMFKGLGVEEALAADILGHEHDKITYGVYASEQARLETLKPVVELLAYPGL